MRILVQSLLCVLGIMCFSACIEEIEFDVPNEFQNTTVIVGKIVKGNPSTVEVFIQKVFDFSFQDEIFVNAQSVQIVNESGDRLDVPISGSGRYTLKIDPSTGFEVEVGKQFHLEIRLFDGQSFRTIPSTLLAVPKMKALSHSLIQKEIINFENEVEIQPRIQYRVDTDLLIPGTNTPANLKWDFERTYKQTDDGGRSCYVDRVANFDLIQTVNAKDLNSNSLVDFTVLEQAPNNTMVEGQYVAIVQESLDEQAVQFWQQTREVSVNNGTFYEPPPGQVITNVEITSDTEGSAFGYFYATEQDTLRAFVDSTFINLYSPVCPRPPGQNPNPPCADCCDCRNLERSSINLPPFWVD